MNWALYFIFGIGFYIGLACKEPEGFVNSSVAGLIRGLLLGILFWPIGIVVSLVFAMDRLRNYPQKTSEKNS